MRDNYEYIDSDYIYTDPKNGVLRNLKNISDRNLLTIVESFEVSRRLVELSKKHIPIAGSETLLDIHKYIFQDIYQWAGEKRTVNISKQGSNRQNNHFSTDRKNVLNFRVTKLTGGQNEEVQRRRKEDVG
jgi:cell filamentation protein